jgi:hypothetical protein
MSSTNDSATQAPLGHDVGASLSPDDLGSVPSIYAHLIDDLHRISSQSEFSPYQSPLRMLLRGFNPRFQSRFWRSPLVRSSFSNPDAFQQELPFSADFLRVLETFTPGQLEALYQCNQINLRRLSKRILMNNLNKILIAVTGIIGLLVSLRQAFGMELAIPRLFPAFVGELLTSAAVGGAIGIVINSVIGYLVISPKLNLLRAFNDLLLVARAYASTSKNASPGGAT